MVMSSVEVSYVDSKISLRCPQSQGTDQVCAGTGDLTVLAFFLLFLFFSQMLTCLSTPIATSLACTLNAS